MAKRGGIIHMPVREVERKPLLVQPQRDVETRRSRLDIPAIRLRSLDETSKWGSMKRDCMIFFSSCQRFCINMRNRIPLSLILFILLVLSGSTVYMGVSNVSLCPASAETPIQVLILGISTFIVIVLRLVNLKLRSDADFSAKPVLMVVTALCTIATFSFFLAHVITFLNISADSDSLSENYCNKIFYDYTYYTNFVVLVISCIVLLLHMPCTSFVLGRVERYEVVR
ncbi:hypothetical protein TNCT_602991 [Trichonephila clavata]|uniref:Uncharacterized protein n=1 Tax=Trichonephila clavata TaxID=2740835 RepID=A0A8X6FYJ8_TRICU|nr:hypothetical protein TNCT_602991 [Trichonephila clavata]